MQRRTILLLSLIAVSLIGFLVLYKYLNPTQYSFYPQCPIKATTGLDCPGCGNQRALHYLLNGEIKKAFQQNQLTFFAVPYVLLGFYFEYKKTLSHKELKWRKILYGRTAIILAFSIVVLFTILRNLLH